MSLQAEPIGAIPEQTARVAHAAFPADNPYVRMRDELESLVEDRDLAHFFPRRGQPAERPWRLALITIFQFVEDLSDRQAADCVRARIDWKDALGLELDHPGFDHTVLSEFRGRLVDDRAEQLLFDLTLERFRQKGLLNAHGRQRTDSSHVLAAVRALNRPIFVGHDQLLDLGAEMRTATWRAGLPAPDQTPALSMPARHRVGRDDPEVLTPASAESPGQNPQQLFPGVKPNTPSASSGAGQDGELMTREQVLEGEVFARANRRQHSREQQPDTFGL